MVSISSLALTPTISTASFTAQALPSADRVSLRQTPVAVIAPLHDERVGDNNRQALSTPNESSDSATYVTQALSQASEEATSSTLGAFSPFAPALQYNKLVSYSLVKYKPSDAGLPSGKSTPAAVAPATEHQDSAIVATEYQAYSNTQLRNLSELTLSTPPVLIAG